MSSFVMAFFRCRFPEILQDKSPHRSRQRHVWLSFYGRQHADFTDGHALAFSEFLEGIEGGVVQRHIHRAVLIYACAPDSESVAGDRDGFSLFPWS